MSARRSAARAIAALLLGGAGAGAFVGGCKIDVQLGFPACNVDGTIYEVGETYLDADGCNTCTCQASGSASCTELECPKPCPEPVTCPAPGRPGCDVKSECLPDGTWQCSLVCPCDGAPVPDCPVPLDGCYYAGPICENDQWSCGPQVCPPCMDEPVCQPPVDPSCSVEFYCSELGWQCTEVCPPVCLTPPPQCGSFSQPTCIADEVWVCEGNATCAGMVPECVPSLFPYCQTFGECHQVGWECQEICDLAYCPDPEPMCESMGPPTCTAYPACTVQGWVCAESCS